MRVFTAFLIAALGLGAAVWLHDGWKPERYAAYGFVCSDLSPRPGSRIPPEVYRCKYTAHRPASWQDPLAVVVGVAGVGVGVSVGRRKPPPASRANGGAEAS